MDSASPVSSARSALGGSEPSRLSLNFLTAFWSALTAVLPGITLDRYLDGTTAVTSPKPSLYVARFPLHHDYVDSGYFIKTITLPRIGTDLRNTCSSPALHVFALSLTAD